MKECDDFCVHTISIVSDMKVLSINVTYIYTFIDILMRHFVVSSIKLAWNFADPYTVKKPFSDVDL